MRNLIYQENKSEVQPFKSIMLLLVIGASASIILFNILITYDTLTGAIKEEDIIKSTVGVVIIDVMVTIGILLMLWYIIDRVQFQLFSDGFIPPRIPKNRRRQKEKHFISINEIEKLELTLWRKEPYERNYINVTLTDGTEFYIIEADIKRRGLLELMKFKEMHKIKGDRQVNHPTLGWLKNEEIDKIPGLLDET